MKDYETEKTFRKIDKFGIQLLIGFVTTILLLVGLNTAFAGPDDWIPPTGNARVEDEMYALPYGFFYNPDTGYWLFVEFFSPTSACVIGVGEGVDFDVQGEETKAPY
jgi:hypothetical protein